MEDCRYCNGKIEIFLDLSDIPISVTSDSQLVSRGIKLYKCKECGLLQKISSENIQQDYFNKFENQSLTSGNEQVKFVDGIAYPRSELIINNIKPDIKEKGSLLDIGTGSGVFIKSFQKKYPQWELSAQDIQSNSSKQLFKIIDEKNFYLGDIGIIDKKYDLISIIGVLGHIPDLIQFLFNLKNLLNSEGKVVMYTPNIQKNLFEIVIVDEITYFTKSDLYKILSKYFNKVDFFEAVHKELTIGINFDQNGESFNEKEEDREIKRQSILLEKFVRYIYESNEKFIVFGSATVSSYIAGILADRCLYFIDEDSTKHNKIHLNKEIKKIEDTDKEYKILLPFLDETTIDKITNKYPKYKFVSCYGII